MLTCKYLPDGPQRPKTHCEHHRERALSATPEGYPAVGVYVPQCDASGQYLPLQVSIRLLTINAFLSLMTLVLECYMSKDKI